MNAEPGEARFKPTFTKALQFLGPDAEVTPRDR
jgi:hypothetical protein